MLLAWMPSPLKRALHTLCLQLLPMNQKPNQSSYPTPNSGMSCAGHKSRHRWCGLPQHSATQDRFYAS
jgi:hypothetical protein